MAAAFASLLVRSVSSYLDDYENEFILVNIPPLSNRSQWTRVCSHHRSLGPRIHQYSRHSSSTSVYWSIDVYYTKKGRCLDERRSTFTNEFSKWILAGKFIKKNLSTGEWNSLCSSIKIFGPSEFSSSVDKSIGVCSHAFVEFIQTNVTATAA